jgi:hypothetical protein
MLLTTCQSLFFLLFTIYLSIMLLMFFLPIGLLSYMSCRVFLLRGILESYSICTLQRRMVGWLMNNGMGRVWKENVVA